MTPKTRDVLAIALSGAALVVGISAWLGDRIEPGIDMTRLADGTVEITRVWPGGQAFRNGATAGMHVLFIGENAAVGIPDNATPPSGPLDPAPLGYYWMGGINAGGATAIAEDRGGRLGQSGNELATRLIREGWLEAPSV
jgi:hypothetical protein